MTMKRYGENGVNIRKETTSADIILGLFRVLASAGFTFAR